MTWPGPLASLHVLLPSCLQTGTQRHGGKDGAFLPGERKQGHGNREAEGSQLGHGKSQPSLVASGLNARGRTGFISPVDRFPLPERSSPSQQSHVTTYDRDLPQRICKDGHTPSLSLGWPEAPLPASPSKTFSLPATAPLRASGDLASSQFIPLELPRPWPPAHLGQLHHFCGAKLLAVMYLSKRVSKAVCLQFPALTFPRPHPHTSEPCAPALPPAPTNLETLPLSRSVHICKN